jgi:osmotically-inducible protein OsmY
MHAKTVSARRLAPPLLAVLLLAAACATQPGRTPAERAMDGALAREVEATLLEDPGIFARHIDVTADRGVVTLSGFVWSTDDLYAAERLAANVPGVTRVDSDLELVVGGRTGAR